MKITWIGNHEEGLEAFRQTAGNNGIDAFITLSDAAFAKRSAGSRDYLDICREYGIPVHPVDTIKDEHARRLIESHCPDLLVVFGWSEILPPEILAIPTIGTVGTHASLLPHNRGSAPVNWALIHGETQTGNTMMWLSAEVDAGAIVDQVAFPISIFDTCKTLYAQVAKSNATMLASLLESLARGIKPVLPIPNVSSEPILPRRRPKDGLLDWNQTAKAVYDFVRALAKPYPGAFSFLDGKKYVIWEAAVLPLATPQGAIPGQILGTSYGFAEGGVGICVATRDLILLITSLMDENGGEWAGPSLYSLNLKGVFSNG